MNSQTNRTQLVRVLRLLHLRVALWRYSYFYPPRLGVSAAVRRLIRICVLLTVLIIAYFLLEKGSVSNFLKAHATFEIPSFDTTQMLDSTEDIIDDSQLSQSSDLAVSYYLVKPVATTTVRDVVLAKRIQKRQKRITELAKKNRSTPQSFVHTGVQSQQFAEYELIIERALVTKGNLLYQQHYGRRGLQGQGIMRLVILADGNLAKVELMQSSGNTRIDSLLVEAANATAPFPPLPFAKKQYTFERVVNLSPY